MRPFIFIILLIVCQNLFSQQQADKIAAIVDNEVILLSEINFQTNLLASQRKLDPNDPSVKEQVIKLLVEEKLLLAQALIDSVVVTEDEVTRQLDYQLEMFIQQYGSRDRVEQIYGMPFEKIRRELRDDIRKNVLVQKMQEKKFGFIESSRREVEEFFEVYKDSLGVIPEKVKVAHIFRNPKTSGELKKKYFEKASKLLDSIKNGADFASLAKEFSDDPGSAAIGGDLGFVKRGVFYPEFEAAAFALAEGEISKVTESPVGYHIIQLLERRGESIKTRHILIKIKADDEADLAAIEFLTDIRDSIVRLKTPFSDLAKKYSDDKETAVFGGALGTFYLNQLDKNLLDAVSKLKEGEISFPKRIDYSADTYGYHIVFLEKKIPQHKPDLEIDFADLKKLSEEYKKQRLYSEWMEELKSKIFWEIKI
ncbi:MAG: peptidylprolyl isomerase [Ignavibacteriaceae bacterium]|nr:peptidylprolyl isomerase [Ignavibacteriaceae bacterium]